jgi:hypothetical protein
MGCATNTLHARTERVGRLPRHARQSISAACTMRILLPVLFNQFGHSITSFLGHCSCLVSGRPSAVPCSPPAVPDLQALCGKWCRMELMLLHLP